MEKFRISATLVTLHLFKQAFWEDKWKLTFENSTHMQVMWLCICSIRQFEKTFENHLMEKFCISATLVTLHLFNQAIWEDMWKLTFEKITHMQLMWLCICSSRRFEKTFQNNNGEISHICNYCDFASVQAGNLRRHVKTNNSEYRTWIKLNFVESSEYHYTDA